MVWDLDICGVSWYCRLNLHQPSTFIRPLTNQPSTFTTDNKHNTYILLPISFSTTFSTILTQTVEKFRNHRLHILFDFRITHSHQFFHDDFTELFVVDVSEDSIVHTVSYQDGLGIHQGRVDHPSLTCPCIVVHTVEQSYRVRCTYIQSLVFTSSRRLFRTSSSYSSTISSFSSS